MKAKRWIVTGVIATTAAAMTALAATSNQTFRTSASVASVFQIANPIATNTDILFTEALAGHNLVALALGTNVEAVLTNQVLAFEINCGSTTANLTVFDRSGDSNLMTIATSTKITALTAQDSPSLAGPNHERFVVDMGVATNGFIIGGEVTIAGRMYLNPATGCPRAVLVDTDRGEDKLCGDSSVKDTADKTEKDKMISGEAHLIGVVNVLQLDGSTNAVLLPFGHLTMRRQLLP